MNLAVPSPSSPTLHPLRRHAGAIVSVLALHVAALWALQQGLLQHMVETVVPVAVVSEVLTPPVPRPEAPPAPVVPPKPQPVRETVQRKPTPAPLPPAPKPMAIRDNTPSPLAPTGTTEPQPAPPPIAAPVAAAPAPAPAPAPVARVELPTKDADYLHNPPPPYPPMSYRLGEEGMVIVHVLIGVDGTAQDARLEKTSGFDRLDAAAVKAARSWRYVPGKRGGVPEAMWVNVPVNWELRKN